MISTNPHAQQVAALLLAHGVTDVVISPGSRSGALVHTFSGCGQFNCRSIVDERSAGYFALGLAQAVSRPVALLCSSGTATLNYAPAVAEAFYQGIPLIVLTADRPPYWIGQMENQCLKQSDIYHNFVNYHASLPLAVDEKSLWFAARQINEAVQAATTGKNAPVHLNIPFEEPLHETVDTPLPAVKSIHTAHIQQQLSDSEQQQFINILQASPKILIIVGQQPHNKIFSEQLQRFANTCGAVIFAEALANTDSDKAFSKIDMLCKNIGDDGETLRPDLLISCGGQVVSKSLKSFLRKHRASTHYHIGADGEIIDTYQSLTNVVPLSPEQFFSQINAAITPTNRHAYHQAWQAKQNHIDKRYHDYLATAEFAAEFADLGVYQAIFQNIPGNSVIHLGNSSAVRYALMNARVKNAVYLGNRGVSGIDGSLSTAIGYAWQSPQINTVVLGDLSFLYDSNALWNAYLGENLRIIVINNGGGNIFGLLETLAQTPHFREHFFTAHGVTAQPFAKAFAVDYLQANNSQELQSGLTALYSPTREQATLLEIFTDADINTATYQQFINQLHAI